MSCLIRLLLSCLLAIALPLQGHAAQTLRFCGPAHPVPAAAGAPHGAGAHEHRLHAHAAHAQASAADAAPSHDAFAAADPAQADGPQAGDRHGEAPAADLPQPKCSVCASCYSLAVLPAVWLQPAAVGATFDYTPASFEPHAGRVPGGLERPPKPGLA